MKSKLILRKLLPLVLHPFRYFALAIALSMTFCLATPDCMARSIQNGAFESFHQQAGEKIVKVEGSRNGKSF